MGTNRYWTSHPYEMYSERWYSIDKKRKSLYTVQDLAETTKLLKDFGVRRTELYPPESVRTYGQLQRWKWLLINKVLEE
ncbi:MAG: hypothetical protein IJM49_05490 [Firmicutes bacterium]|nr:hypothetical protein [Bacillota bacterium]MBR0481863.1 hypothetical protein [Bacillota bacterium]